MVMFCQLSVRALVAPQAGLGGIPLTAPWWRQLAGSALAYGASRWRVRASGHSFTGSVVSAAFDSRERAVAFAKAWGWWCGCRIAVRRRRSRGQSVWAVSVPVHWRTRGAEPASNTSGYTYWVPRG